MKLRLALTLLPLTLGLPFVAQAEVVSATSDHFTLKLEATSDLSPEDVWARLIVPADWWLGDHSYSGDAANMSLDPVAGGTWREDWAGGAVWHGTVLQAQPNKVLSLSAPFGPLQGMAVRSVWTISLTPDDAGGTKIRFDHVTNGSAASNLHEIAPAVDFVKSEALKSLARPHDDS